MEITAKELGEQMKTLLTAEFSTLKAERATADESRKKEIDGSLASLATRLDGIEKRLVAENKASIPGLEYGRQAEKGKLSWARVMQICADPERMHKPGYETEKEAYEIQQKTAMNVGTGAAGGFLVPTTMMAGILPELRERSVARQLGATIMSGLSPGNYQLVKSKGGITAEHLNTENEDSGTESVATFDLLNLTPRPIASFVPLTYQMMTQSAESIEAWVRNEIATQIALLQDKSFFVGTGASGAPRGIFNHPSIQFVDCQSTAVDTTAEVWAALVSFVLKTRKKFALNLGGLGWVAAPDVLYHLAKVKDTTGRPVFDTLSTAAFSATQAPASVMRYPIVDSAQIQTGTATAERLMFGPWSAGVIAEWGSLRLAMSDQTETNFRKGRATVRGIAEYDCGFFYPDAFVHAGSDAATPNYNTTAATP